jgi:hypothetical protein
VSDLQCPARLYLAWPRPERGAGEDPEERVAAREGSYTVHRVPPGTPVDLVAVADVHRGEAVLVLVSAAPALLPDLRPGDVLALEVDADGVRRV